MYIFVVFCFFSSKLSFLKNSFKTTIRVANSLYPDQASLNVSPDLGTNCLFVCFVALRPKSTAMVMAGRSVHLTTLFLGQVNQYFMHIL